MSYARGENAKFSYLLGFILTRFICSKLCVEQAVLKKTEPFS